MKRLSPMMAFILVQLLFGSQLSLSCVEEDPFPRWDDPNNGVNNVQYVNLTNPSSNWTTRFYGISFPQGSWERVTVTLRQVNLGDPWDRANAVGVNSVMILEMTTKENSTVLRNPVQTYTRDVTIYSRLFNTSAEVYWSAMPNYQGGWYCELSFTFYPGTPQMMIPEIVPALFHTTLSGTNTTSVNVTFPPNVTSAKAVLTEEGFSNEEFWFANAPPTVRDYTLDVDNTRVFDMTAYPYLNSGACLNPPNCWTLYEWNGTPPLGTGLRPQHIVDVSPFVYLLNGSRTLSFGIGNGVSYWKVSLAFLVWRNPRLDPYVLDTNWSNRTATNNQQFLESSASAHRPVPNGIEYVKASYKSWLNASFPTVTTHTIAIVSRTIMSATVTITLEQREETFHNVSRDSSGAGDVEYSLRMTNTSISVGNGQDSVRTDSYSFSSFIDGELGGRSSTDTRLWSRHTYGNYSHMGIEWECESLLWRNMTSTLGVGQDETPYLYENLSGAPFAFPAVFFVEPAYNGEIGDAETYFAFLLADYSIVNATLAVDSVSYDITGDSSFRWNTTEAYGARFSANVTAVNAINVTSFNEIRLLGTKTFLSIDFTGRMGWNLISIPQALGNNTIESVLSSIEGSYDAVRYYDAFDVADPWKTYQPFKSYGDLGVISPEMGFWINMTAATKLEVVGPLPNVTSVLLKRGWNMVGFPSLVDNYNVADLMADTGATRVEGFSSLSPYHLAELTSDYVLKQGEGYWVHVPDYVYWSVPLI